MADWTATLKTLAPTVASALFGPLGAAATQAVGSLLGLSDATTTKIASAITAGQMSPEQLGKLKELELEYQNEESQRGFKFSELEFKDRDSARQANVTGGTQKMLFWLSLALLTLGLGTEIAVMFAGYPSYVSEIVVGRVLGLMDATVMMILGYWYGTSNSSSAKTQLLAQAQAGSITKS